MNYLFALIPVIIFSGNNVINRQAVGILYPAEIGFYRWLVAALILSAFLLPSAWRYRREIAAHAWQLIALGLLGMTLYQSLAYYAATYTTATHMGIIASLMPLMALGLSTRLLGVSLTRGGLLGAVVSLTGVLIIVSGGNPARLLQQGVNQGDVMMVLATFSYATYGVLLKRWQPPFPKLLLLYLQVLVAVVSMLPLFLLSPHVGITAAGVPLVLYAGVLASIAAPLLWMSGIARIGPSRASLFFNLLPVLTALFAALFLGEQLTRAVFIGGGLALGGVLIAELWRRPLRVTAPARPSGC